MIKFFELSKSANFAVESYDEYLKVLLPKIEKAVKDVIFREGYNVEVIKTYGSWKGFSVFMINLDPNVEQLSTGYVVTFEARPDCKLGVTQINLVDFTLDEIYSIQKVVEEILAENKE